MPPEIEKKFNPFLAEIIDNFDALVNTDYDPYGITFPQKYEENEIVEKYEELVNEMEEISEDG